MTSPMSDGRKLMDDGVKLMDVTVPVSPKSPKSDLQTPPRPCQGGPEGAKDLPNSCASGRIPDVDCPGLSPESPRGSGPVVPTTAPIRVLLEEVVAGSVVLSFPPSPSELEVIHTLCDQGRLPLKIGEGVTLEEYNAFLMTEGSGLRTSYDPTGRSVIVREGCAKSHGAFRAEVRNSLRALYLPHGYTAFLGRIESRSSTQDFSPDVTVGTYVAGVGEVNVIALEVGVSQSVAALNHRAELLLAGIPSLVFVVLAKVHDEPGPLNGRLYAWVVTRNGGAPQILPGVEFGRVDATGAPRPVWIPQGQAPPPVLPLPPIPAGPAAGVGVVQLNFSAALEVLREAGGIVWRNHPPP